MPDEDDAQEAVRRARADVLGGRGPGASDHEVLAHTRARTSLGHRPVAQVRADVAHQTALARGGRRR